MCLNEDEFTEFPGCLAHNMKVVGSNTALVTIRTLKPSFSGFIFYLDKHSLRADYKSFT